MKKVIVIGGGAAGLMAAAAAARRGARVTVLEKMPRVGKKLLITGKGRCNMTNAADAQTLIRNLPGNGVFLHSAFHAFGSRDTIAFFEQWGVPAKVERGGRVFPASDRAADVVGAFKRALNALQVEIAVGAPAVAVQSAAGRAAGALTAAGAVYEGDAVILATGGCSYPKTGSTGDGYRMAAALGHTVTKLRPSLAPLETAEEWARDLQGLSLKNVAAAVWADGVKIASDFGEMLFTHFGVSGPIILSLSKAAANSLSCGRRVEISLNLKPALTKETLDKRLQRDFTKFARKQFKNALGELLPAKLIPAVVDLSYIDGDKAVHQVTRAERARLADVLTDLRLTVTGTRPIEEAIVTAGGVSVKEINPKTMESKLMAGLYFAGEVIDVDGYTGGYNLQAAFSSGYSAGRAAAE